MQKNSEKEKRLAIGVAGMAAVRLLCAFAAGFLIGKVRIGGELYPFSAAYILTAFMNFNSVNPFMASGGVPRVRHLSRPWTTRPTASPSWLSWPRS